MLHKVIVLKNHADMLSPKSTQMPIRKLGDRLALYQNFTAAGTIQSGYDSKQCSFAAAAYSLQDYTLALCYIQIDITQSMKLLIA